MNVNGFIGMFAFAAIWVFCRIFCSWLVRLSYVSAGETVRSVEKRSDMMKRGLVPKTKEIQWLSEVSARPVITKILYYAYYIVTWLPILGIALSALNVFVPALDTVVNKTLNVIFLVPFVSMFLFLFFNDPIEYVMKKIDRKRKRENR